MGRGARVTTFLIVLLATLAAPVPSDACSCMETKPVCEAFWQAPIVFAGEVLDIAEIEPPTLPNGRRFAGDRLVKLRVDGAFRGTRPGIVEVQTGSGGGDCGYPFERGRKYLVFAHVVEGRITASICSRTKPREDAAEDLAYVSQRFLPSVGGRVFGDVRLGGDDQRLPAAGYQVKLSNTSREWAATTDAHGRFDITDVPPGKFKIGVVVDDGEFAYGPHELHLADARGCASADFTVVQNGRVVVKVLQVPVGSDQRPQMQLIEADTLNDASPRERYPFRGPAVPESGDMEWAQLPPGRYVLGVNIARPPTLAQPYPRTFYPGVSDPSAAMVIQVGPGERVELEPFTFPAPLRAIAVRGTVVRPDSRVVPGLNIHLLTVEGRFITSTTTDREGRFTLQGLEGVRYQVRALAPELKVESNPFELTPATAPILIVLRPPK